ncbi:hypothetical protein [Lachnobacterium bovis]|uniref:Uncharacterized protein n=1 Tax=Lachnobacterium bovis TaxID=140626 RepID=A0A1H9SAU0_9FIRM|nr:hypothetical protein [Lachnobacterium bovis]SER82156.1 hypothetical protein SAMN02910429_01175 [Lachnobacterium bovis]
MKKNTPKRKNFVINSVKAFVSIALLLVIVAYAPNLTNSNSHSVKANISYCQNK